MSSKVFERALANATAEQFCIEHKKSHCKVCMREEMHWKKKNGFCSMLGCWEKQFSGVTSCCSHYYDFKDDPYYVARRKIPSFPRMGGRGGIVQPHRSIAAVEGQS